MTKTFFTSDTHFEHEKIIGFCKRPFANVSEMNEALIRNWNAVVAPDDLVYHLGDFSFGTRKQWREVTDRLNGQIALILGNHDKNVTKDDFVMARDLAEVEVEGQKIVLCHYGMRTWRHDLRGTWHLYGHSHGMLPPYGKSCDVGVDAWGFTPVSFERLKKFMDAREVGDHPMFEQFRAEQEKKSESQLHKSHAE